MMERKKTLPMQYPPITSFPPHADLLSVILNHEETLPWFYSHYIQLVCHKNVFEPTFRVDFFKPAQWHNCPFINNQKINRDLIARRWSAFADFLIDCLDLGYYIMFYLDEYFVSNYKNYQKKHLKHDIFIFGYDLDNRTFDVADFFANRKYYYTKSTFSEIEQGYQNLHLTDICDYLKGIELIDYRLPTQGYKFDINIPARLIEDYLLSYNTSQRYDLSPLDTNANTVSGIAVYNTLIEYLQKISEHKIKKPDLRSFHVLYDHKSVMLLKIKYFMEHNYIKEGESLYNAYVEILEKTKIVKILVIKYILARDIGLLDKIISRLQLIMLKERETLERILTEMQRPG
jgi:hypothetical protein